MGDWSQALAAAFTQGLGGAFVDQHRLQAPVERAGSVDLDNHDLWARIVSAELTKTF